MFIGGKWMLSAVVSATLLAVAGTATTALAADPVLSRGSYAPSGTWSWVSDASLGNTASAAQYAQADVVGLTDADHNAGFRLRYGSSYVLVAVSGTAWKIEPSGGVVATGTFAHGASGTLRTTIDASGVVAILWNGSTVATRAIAGSYPGRGVAPSVWQSSGRVKMSNIRAGTLGGTSSTPSPTTSTTKPSTPTSTSPAASTVTQTVTSTVTKTVTHTVTSTVTVTAGSAPTSTPAPTTSTQLSTSPSSSGQWLSGAASVYAANGSYGAWRGEPVRIVGTWSDGKDCAATLCTFQTTGDMAEVKGNDIHLDLAIGAIYDGQTWAEAAKGAYDGQWRTTLNALKSKVATKNMDPGKVFIRFAHELNGNWYDWEVRSGEEASFRAAITRFSTLRYEVFGAANPPKVVLCPANGTANGRADPRTLFVGKDSSNRTVVDVYGIDIYNQYPHRTDAAAIWNAFNDVNDRSSIESHRRFAQSAGVPFAVGEWGNCGIVSHCAGNNDGQGEAPAYVEQLNRYFRAHAGNPAQPAPGQLLYEVQFNLWDRFALYGSQAHQPATSAAYAAAVWGR